MVGVQRKRVVKDKARKVYTSQMLQGLGSCKEILLSSQEQGKTVEEFYARGWQHQICVRGDHSQCQNSVWPVRSA